jgi:choline dehydrogenase
VKARNEVILSAGTIGTTQILQLSGIGNADDLKALKIPVLINNPAVGANLIDHVFLPNIFNAQESLDTLLRDSSLLGAAIEEWTTNRTGIIANNIANTFGFARLPSNSPIFKTISDPASGPKSPHWEMLFSVSSLDLFRISLWPVLIFQIGFLGQPGHCSTSYGKLLNYSNRAD